MNGAFVGTGAGAWVSERRQPGEQEGLPGVLQTTLCGQLPPPRMGNMVCGEMHLELCRGSELSRNGVWSTCQYNLYYFGHLRSKVTGHFEAISISKSGVEKAQCGVNHLLTRAHALG